jgi:hypothetical protein
MSYSILSWFFVLLLFVAEVALYFCGAANGLNYLYQNFVGQVFGFIFLVFAFTFDREIHRMCEKSGFILRASRGAKFQIFFMCLAMFVAQSFYYLSEYFTWNMPQVWVYNGTDNGT